MFRGLIKVFLLGFIAMIITGAFTSTVSALTVGHVGGKGLNPELTAGESYIQSLTVALSKDDSACDVLIEILGYLETDNGIQPSREATDTSPYSARTFFEPGQVLLHCKPGETRETQVKVTIPENAQPGGRYAIIRFTTIPKVDSGVGIVSSIILPVKFTVLGGPLIHTGELNQITVGPPQNGKPIEIFADFKNTGNHHFDIRGEIEITDSAGKLIDTVYLSTSSPVPEQTKKIKSTYIPRDELQPGMYSAKYTLKLEDGTLLGEGRSSFQIDQSYLPPPAPASALIKPSQSGTLQTGDGRITISFPAGAVIGEAQISIQPYPLEQLPPSPPNFVTGTTCFRIDGLNGLLVKDASIAVEYSRFDLEKAGGDPSKLVLARWDDTTEQWVILKTRINKENTVLATNTNRFSLWAIMVKTRVPTNMLFTWRNIVLVGGVVALIILGTLLVWKRKH